jgi:glycerate dehydrogenase
VTATGYDNVDTLYCRSRGIAVCNVKGYSTDSVAQVTMALTLSLYTHIREYTDYVSSGKYTQSGVHNYLKPTFHEISGKTWGIVGLGGIGRRVAQLAQAMGCRISAFKRSGDDEFNCVDLDTLCRECDIISVHLPLTDETRGIIDAARIGMMKDGAILINMARGAVIDEAAAANAVEFGKLGGLGIDVYSAEPMAANHPYARIASRSNVLLTPHMAWGAYEARVRCMNEIAENIRAFLRGEMRNRV